jgi:hypothetical protein
MGGVHVIFSILVAEANHGPIIVSGKEIVYFYTGQSRKIFEFPVGSYELAKESRHKASRDCTDFTQPCRQLHSQLIFAILPT